MFNHYWGLNIYLCVASLWCMRYEGDYFESWTIKRKWMLNRLIKRPTDNIDRVQGDGHISSQSSVYWHSGLTLGNYLYFHTARIQTWLLAWLLQPELQLGQSWFPYSCFLFGPIVQAGPRFSQCGRWRWRARAGVSQWPVLATLHTWSVFSQSCISLSPGWAGDAQHSWQ